MSSPVDEFLVNVGQHFTKLRARVTWYFLTEFCAALCISVEVCMGMGIPIPMGFPWDSHGNVSSFGLLMGMGTGMGIVLMGMGTAYFIGET